MSVLIGRGQLMPLGNYRHSVSSRRIRDAQWFKQRYVLRLTIPAPLASLPARKQCNRLNKTWHLSRCRRSPNLNFRGHSPSRTRFRHPIGARTDSAICLLAWLMLRNRTKKPSLTPLTRGAGGLKNSVSLRILYFLLT